MANFLGTNENEIESGYFGEVPSDDPLVRLGVIDKITPEATGISKVFARQSVEKQVPTQTGLIGSIKESAGIIGGAFKTVGEGIVATTEGVSEGIFKFGADINKLREGTILEEVVFDKISESGIEKGILGKIVSAGLQRVENLEERKVARGDEALTGFEKGVEVFGQGAGIIQDIFGEAFMSGLETIATDEQEVAVKDGITELLQSEKGQQGVVALQEGIDSFDAFEEENPRIGSLLRTGANLGLIGLDVSGLGAVKGGIKKGSTQIDEISEGIVRTIKESPDLIDTSKLGDIATRKAGKLERSATEATRVDAEQIALESVSELGKRQKGKVFRDVIETGKGPFKKTEIIRSPREALAIEETAKLLEQGKISKGMTPIAKQKVIESEIETISKTLAADLRVSGVSLPKKEMDDLFESLSKSILENPTIVGNAESAINKLLPQLKTTLNKDKFFPEDILQLRKDFDALVRKARGEGVFDPNLENAFTAALKDFRQGLNKKVSDLVPDANVQRQLDRQSALFEVSSTLENRFASQANSLVGRILSKIQGVTGVPRTEIVELVTGLGLAGVAIPVVGPLAAGLGTLALGREGIKLLTRPSIKRKIASILREFDNSIKASPKNASKIKSAKKDFENFIDNPKIDGDTDLSSKLNSVDSTSTSGGNIKNLLGDIVDDIADKVGARSKFIDDSGKGLDKVGTTKSAIKQTKDKAKDRFNLDDLKQFSTVGEGSDRIVFDIGNNKVLKVAKNPRGIDQNLNALNVELQNSGIIPKVSEVGKDFVIMEKVRPFAELTIPEKKIVQNLIDDVKNLIRKEADLVEVKTVLSKYGWEDLSKLDHKTFGWGDIQAKNLSFKNGQPILLDEGTINLIPTLNKYKRKVFLAPIKAGAIAAAVTELDAQTLYNIFGTLFGGDVLKANTMEENQKIFTQNVTPRG